MTKHTLVGDGAPYTQFAPPTQINPDKSTKGEGSALCACGWLSEYLPSRAARKAAHAEHKASFDAPDTETQEDAPVTAETASDVEPEVSEAVAFPETIASRFWGVLSQCAVTVAGTVEGIEDARPDGVTRSIVLEGTDAAVEFLLVKIPEFWDNALAALKAAIRAGEIAKSAVDENGRRPSRFNDKKAWLLAFSESYDPFTYERPSAEPEAVADESVI